jgi:dTDP-4-dehydrorhamnose reductase
MKVLITGACRPIGLALVRSAPPHADLRALTHAELDIADRGDVRAAVAVFQPELIINAAAPTAAPRFLAQAARSILDCRMLHVSTELADEDAVLEELRERAVVLRTAWAHQRGTPTPADSIARALWAIAERPGIRGIVHWTDDGDASWQSLAAGPLGAGG